MLAACKEENAETQQQLPRENQTVVGEQKEPSGKDPLENLRERAVREDDKAGRIAATLIPLREAFAKAEKEGGGTLWKNVQIEMAEDCILHLFNQARGNEEIRVDLTRLNINGFSLIADRAEGEYPGLRIRTIGGQAAVEIYRNGKLAESLEALEIYMPERKHIEQITPIMVQLLRICYDLQ